MISTVTLNASIDKAYQLACPLVDGTVMRVETCIDNAGGKGLNAARAVATCGERVVAEPYTVEDGGKVKTYVSFNLLLSVLTTGAQVKQGG